MKHRFSGLIATVRRRGVLLAALCVLSLAFLLAGGIGDLVPPEEAGLVSGIDLFYHDAEGYGHWGNTPIPAKASEILRVSSAGTSLEFVAPSIVIDNPVKHVWINETFDGLTTGDITGQGSYTECGAWDTALTGAGAAAEVAVKSGADKMLSLIIPAAASGSSAHVDISSVLGLTAGFHLHCKMRIPATDVTGGVIVNDGTTTKTSIRFGYPSSVLKLRHYNGTSYVDLQNVSINTWYTVDMIVVIGTTTWYAWCFIDGAYVGQAACGSAAKLTTVNFYHTNTSGGDRTMDFDDFYVRSLLPLGF